MATLVPVPKRDIYSGHCCTMLNSMNSFRTCRRGREAPQGVHARRTHLRLQGISPGTIGEGAGRLALQGERCVPGGPPAPIPDLFASRCPARDWDGARPGRKTGWFLPRRKRNPRRGSGWGFSPRKKGQRAFSGTDDLFKSTEQAGNLSDLLPVILCLLPPVLHPAVGNIVSDLRDHVPGLHDLFPILP